MLTLYEFKLPAQDNDGRSTKGARLAWEHAAMVAADGYTQGAVQKGAWRASDGRICYDDIVPYEVACEPETLPALIAAAHLYFPDQEAIYYATLGTVTIHLRG